MKYFKDSINYLNELFMKWKEFVHDLFLSDEDSVDEVIEAAPEAVIEAVEALSPEIDTDTPEEVLEAATDDVVEVEEIVEETVEIELAADIVGIDTIVGDEVAAQSDKIIDYGTNTDVEVVVKESNYVVKEDLEDMIKEIVSQTIIEINKFKAAAIQLSEEKDTELKERLVALEEELKVPSKEPLKVIPPVTDKKRGERFDMNIAIRDNRN